MIETQTSGQRGKPPTPPSVAGALAEPEESPVYHPRVLSIGKLIDKLPLKLVQQLADYIKRIQE